jgi:multidrug efflux system membrane fusion protein
MPDDSRTPTEHPEAYASPASASPTEHPEAHEPTGPSSPSASAPATPFPTEHPETREPKKRKRSGHLWLWMLLGIALLLALGWYFLWPTISGQKAAAAKAAATGPPPIPVVVATSRQGDIGVYDSGLGAVTPLAMVVVRTRVDGQVMSIRYREGDTVQKGDLLAEIDDGPYRAALTQAQGQLMRDQATLENARIDLIRYQQLVPQKAIPEQTLATQQATVHQDEGVVKLDQGLIESAQVNLAYCKIPAPITGRIGLRLVDPGNIVQTSDTTGLLVITQMDPISAIFTIAEDQLQVVLKKMAAGQKLEVDAYDRDSTSKLAQGSLTTLDNQIDPTTGTLKLRATFDNAKGALFPNQFVNLRLLVEEKRGVALVPTAAIQRNSSSTYVYVVKPDSTVTVRTITLGTTEGFDSEVTSGLTPGETVVMTGVDKLQEGTKVSTHTGAAGGTGSTGGTGSMGGTGSKGGTGKKKS